MADKEKNAGQEAAVKKAKKAANAGSTKSGKGKKDGKEKKGFFSRTALGISTVSCNAFATAL